MVQTKTKSESNGISGNVVHGSPSAKERQEPMNLDVLFLIAGYAHPRDLLSLASTCKYFQEPLMDQSSTLVWRTARSKFEGLPDCPADLTEREYANLAFCARCHGCGQYSDTVFWEMRRRYCPDCRVERLCCLSVCDEIIQKKYVLGMGGIGIETPFWVDREQMEAFIDEYKRCSDKKQMLSYRQEQLAPIRRHARQCENWQRADQKRLREERDRSIFEHLKQLGYEPDVEFSGRDVIRESRKSLFNISKPLTDKERTGSIWDRFSIEYAEAAPYVVHACGLDPNVATVEDMERRNARLQCLSCQDWCYSWREAVWHATSSHESGQARWRPIDDDSEEMQKIRAAELADNRDASLRTSRCLLCRPRVGDELLHETTLSHLIHDHDIKWEDTKRGVHYMLVAVREHCSVRRGRGGEEQVKFEVDRYHIYW
ncbi:hypothetical protein OG21DRAFT_1526530 [Imleria badia]|nr:hypothetical protein OG21DRAFT_1526530 [Imleria badia]